uniref:PCI domain-containing protein n=1 Tax=Arcella intermedia TaxID=1963864 RepID=A0A6B2L4N2_9EUKA
MLVIEKKTRQGGDSKNTSRVLVAIVDVCHHCKEYKALNEEIVLLSKRRGLIKEAVKQMVKRVMSFLDSMEYEPKMELLDTLLKVTEGKIFVEKQRARLTMTLAHIREKEGKIAEAAKIIQEVQVETFGAMKKKEKTEYILEQMRLCLEKKDFLRTQLISKKIHPRVLAEPEFEEIKIKFNNLMVKYYSSDRNHLEIAKCYHNIYDTPSVKNHPTDSLGALKLIVLYIVLAEHSNTQSDFINRLKNDPNLAKIPEYAELIKLFLTAEVISRVDTMNAYRNILYELPPFHNNADAKLLEEDLAKRIIQHNIRVVAKYYNRVRTARLSQLLALSVAETEQELSKLVVAGAIFAKIDRPHGIISFQKAPQPTDLLNNWSADIESLLGLVENTCHLIHRENMVHKVANKNV